MVCTVETLETPKLHDPVLIEGLPGIGFVANIATLHLIRELNATKFAEIRSSSFQDIAIVTENGNMRTPINELYYVRRPNSRNDLIIWFGNTQALTTQGQYELCGRILDLAQQLGCRYVITLGGFRITESKPAPQIYCAASDVETLKDALGLGTKIMVGQIFGVAGITIGLARLRNLKAFSLLVETLGTSPDANAARHTLAALDKFLDLTVDLGGLESVAEETRKVLESFGLIRTGGQEKKKEEQPFHWFI